MIREDRPSLTLRRTGAIGDSLCATVVADRLIQMGYNITYQTHPDNQNLLRRHPRMSKVEVPDRLCDINLDGAYENDLRRKERHFHEMFFERAHRQLNPRGLNIGEPRNCVPVITVSDPEKKAIRDQLSVYDRPWVMICPRSDSWAARQVPDGIWSEASKKILGTKFWLGRHPAPQGFIDLKCNRIDMVACYLSVSDVLVSVDTGPLHIGAALGIPIVAIGQSSSPDLHLSDRRDFITISPRLDCLNCQKNVCPLNAVTPPCQNVDPELISAWVNAKINSVFGDTVSAIISIYRPDLNVLNRCLDCVLPQVHEVVVCSDQMGIVPVGARQDPKIRYVKHRLRDIGYGRKQNFCARNSIGKYLLLMNDDLFLDPSAVQHMRDAFKPGVGIVSNLLRFPDGRIYHAGKIRSKGQRGWSHIDWLQRDHTFKDITEIENCCGCCVMVDRKAHFDIGGFDEDFYLYADDDDYSLRMRLAGYKILFTPHSTGIHLEHHSTNKSGNLMQFVTDGNKIFDHKWRAYLDHNINRVPFGDFSYLKA